MSLGRSQHLAVLATTREVLGADFSAKQLLPLSQEPLLSNTEPIWNDLAVLLRSLQFDAGPALEEVHAEYSTTTELADVLQRDADVPFRADTISRPSS